jgi:isopentenyl-diphosphate delta-isomerase
MDHVILVDPTDSEIGTENKLTVHHTGQLHRAFSVFLFNDDDLMLLQQRAVDKYHSGGLFSNTCCSHPRPGEPTDEAAHRRLYEEMGIVCPLHHTFSFIYQADFENGTCEHELDHVFIGRFNGTPEVDPDEVASWRWAPISDIAADLILRPGAYTFWFGHVFDRAVDAWHRLNRQP